MTLVSSNLVEDPKWGRRSLLLYGNAGITASLGALTALYALAPEAGPNQAAVIACILVFVGCYQIGFGPITWLILSEIFPLRIRSAAVSIGTLANFGSNLLVALLFEAEREQLGESALFFQVSRPCSAIAVHWGWFVSVFCCVPLSCCYTALMSLRSSFALLLSYCSTCCCYCSSCFCFFDGFHFRSFMTAFPAAVIHVFRICF